jgi:N-acetylglucosamine-6-sulfatase
VVAELGLVVHASACNPHPSPPNVVVIMTDDQRFDDMVIMPKTVDLIGAKGATFNEYFTDYSLCCPSRSTMLTGLLAKNHGVTFNTGPNGGYPTFARKVGANDLPNWLQARGYKTSHIGKLMNGINFTDTNHDGKNDQPAPPGWDNFQAIDDTGGTRSYNYVIDDNGTLVNKGGIVAGDQNFQTDVLKTYATNYIRDNATSPFYLQVWVAPPHVSRSADDSHGNPVYAPPVPAQRYLHTEDGRALPRPPSFQLNATDTAETTTMYRRRLESLKAADDLVAAVVHELATAWVLHNTYVVFTSDNGWMQGEHGIKQGKALPWEEANHVPLLIRGPGIPAGAVIGDRLTSNVDIAPTIVDWTGATAGSPMDGVSLQHYIDDSTFGANRVLFRESGLPDVGDTSWFYGLRTNKYTYIQWQPVGSKANTVQLYDDSVDPYQMTNLDGSATQASTQAALAARLELMKRCSGTSGPSSCFVTDPTL